MENEVAKTEGEGNTETHAWLKGCFEISEEMTVSARALSEKCRDYYDNKQLTADEVKKLERRGQPPVTINRIKRKINYIVGLEIKKRSDPKAYPRTPKHELDADGATQALRYAADKVNLKKTKTAVAKEMFIEGGPTGAYIGVEKKKNGRIEITVEQLAWDRCFADAHSREPDYSDAQHKGFITWMDESEAKKRFPDREEVISTTVDKACADSKTYDDRPRSKRWVDTKRKRVRVIEIYYQDANGWSCAKLTESGFLQDPHAVEFVDQDGEPECPVELTSANVDRENNRYGEVVELIDLQDEINKRRSKSLHLLTMRQSRFGRGVKDADKQSAELAKPDGKIIADKDEFEVLPTGDMARGQMELLAQATQEMDGAGANSSLQGKGPDAASGRAILANQQGGQIELEALMDELAFWELRVYRQIWNRIRQYWTAETWVRVTDDERNLRFVGLNHPMTNAEYAERQGMAPEEFAQSGLDPSAPAIDPQTGQPMIANNIAELEVDIILDRGPDTITIQQEQFDMLSKVPGIPPDILIEASSLPNKDKVLDRITGKTGPGGQPAEPPPPPPEIVKAQMDAAEKDKDRQLATATKVGDRALEEKKLEAQREKDKTDAQIRLAELKLAARELALKERQAMHDEHCAERDIQEKDKDREFQREQSDKQLQAKASESEAKASQQGDDDDMGMLSPETQSRIEAERVSTLKAKKQSAEQLPQIMIQALQQIAASSQATTQAVERFIEVATMPTEIQIKNGRKRAVKVAA